MATVNRAPAMDPLGDIGFIFKLVVGQCTGLVLADILLDDSSSEGSTDESLLVYRVVVTGNGCEAVASRGSAKIDE